MEKKIVKIKPISVDHGKVKSICYVIDKKLAYISDVSNINENILSILEILNI